MSDRAIPIDGRSYQVDGRAVARRVIPDSVASRPDDNNESEVTGKFGLQIETKEFWPSIGARISGNTSDATRAYLQNEDGSTTISDVDISNLSAGDAVAFDDADLNANDKYRIVIDGEGSSFTVGVNTDADNYPYTSDAVDIIDRVDGGSTDGGNALGFVEIGNVGLD